MKIVTKSTEREREKGGSNASRKNQPSRYITQRGKNYNYYTVMEQIQFIKTF